VGGAGWAGTPALTSQEAARRSLWTLVAGAIIAVAVLVVWIDGARQSFVPCAADCGETFDAIQYASKYRLYGFRYALVQEMSTSAEPERFPLFYTHQRQRGRPRLRCSGSAFRRIGSAATERSQLVAKPGTHLTPCP